MTGWPITIERPIRALVIGLLNASRTAEAFLDVRFLFSVFPIVLNRVKKAATGLPNNPPCKIKRVRLRFVFKQVILFGGW